MNVWFVDDDSDFRELLSRTLNTEPGPNCSHQFSSALRVLATLQLLSPPEVIVLDFKMSEMTGLEALPRLRHLAPAAAVLMFTTFFDITINKCNILSLAYHFRPALIGFRLTTTQNTLI